MTCETAPTHNSQAVLICVGGTPAPVLHVLRHHRPKHVWYFCSPESHTNADVIQAQLDWHPAPRYIEVQRFEELGPCYRELRRKIQDILAETRVSPADVLVDYTGGTKTMSAALVLAGVERFQHFSYVGGQQREKGGLGVVIDGYERVLYQGNPWTELAVREVERACDLWAGCQFEAAAKVLRGVAPKVPQTLRFQALADLAEAMAARHHLDFRKAKNKLANLRGRLPLLFDGRNDHGLLEFSQEAHKICEACATDAASETFLHELLDNALRTATQNRYEDAAARLYRAMEMQGQLWLADKTNHLFVNGRCKAANANQIPAALKTLPECRPDDSGDIKLGLEQVFFAVAALGHERARTIVADLNAQDATGKTKSRWRAATEKRNASILAHGIQSIGAEGFEQMQQIATEFLGFDLTHETNPILPLDTRWLE